MDTQVCIHAALYCIFIQHQPCRIVPRRQGGYKTTWDRVEKLFLTMRCLATYYYANIIHNAVSDPFPYIKGTSIWVVMSSPWARVIALHASHQ